MANEVVNRTVNIFISSGDAQKAYDRLIAQQKKLNDQLAQNPKNAAKIREELAKLEEPIARAAKKLSGELEPSMRDTRATANKLRNELNLMSESDPGFAAKVAQYAQANKELDIQKGKVGLLSQAWKSFWSEAKTVAVGVIVGNTIQTAIQTVLGYVTGIVTGAAKLSDQLADIQRVTGLTTEEVIKLNASFKTIDTRTSVSELRDMAVVAGKLGIAKDDILSFVQATDKLKVALGDELGDVNAITTELGKILNVFEGKITGEGITHLGNAIVDLANKGVASGPFLVDFTQRLAGIAKTSNLSLGAVIGLAAGMEESGQKVESSATAIQKLITTIATDLPKAAKIAGAKSQEEIDQFANLFAKAPQEALLKYAAGLQKNKTSFAEIASTFKDAGEEGARTIATLAVLGQKTDFFSQKINDATEALKGNTEIEEAFRLKNETLGGSLERLGKNFSGMFTSSSFQQGAKVAVNVLNSFVDVIKASFQFVSDHKLLIGSLSSIYLLAAKSVDVSTLATLKNIVVTKAKVAWAAIEKAATQIAVASQLAYAYAVEFLTGRISFLIAVQRIWSTVLSLGAGPLGILLVAIGGIVVATEALLGNTRKLTAEQRIQAEVAKRVADSTIETQNKLKILTEVVSDNKVALENRKKALQELINISPAYLSGLTLENINTDKGREILKGYNAELLKSATLKAKSALLDEESKDKAKNTLDLLKAVKSAHLEDQFAGITKEIQTGAPGVAVQAFLDLRSSGPFAKKLQEFVNQSEDIKSLTDDLTKAAKESVTAVTGGDAGGAGTTQALGKLEKLRQTLKELQDQREKASDDKSISDLNKKIKETEDAIAKLEGKTTKLSVSEKKAATDAKTLADELRKLATSLLPDDTRAQQLEKEIQALDDKYAKFRERAGGNTKLLLQIETLYQIERRKIIDKFQREDEKNFAEALQNRKDQEAAAARQREEFINKLAPVLQKHLDVVSQTDSDINADQAAKKELDLLKAHGVKKLQLQLGDLKKEETQELKALDDRHKKGLISEEHYQNEANLIVEKYSEKRLEIIGAFLDSAANKLQGALNVLEVFSQIRANKENTELDRDKAINDKKRANLDKRLKAGLISQQQYDREIEKLQKQQDAKEKDARLKQFKRDQRAAVIQAGIDGLRAVSKTLAVFGPPVPPNFMGIAAMAYTLLSTALQVKLIASKEPPAFAKGGKLNGKSHHQGGMAVVDHFGRKQAEVEGDEVILNKFTVRDRTRYTVSGTPSQIASALNARHGGVHWDTGATLVPAWKTYKPQPMNFGLIRQAQHYAAGGTFQKTAAAPPAVSDDQNMIATVLAGLSASVDNLNAQLAAGITAKTFITDQEAQQDRLDKIRADGTFKP